MAKKKFYVVWKGATPGVYDSWSSCKAQIDGFEGALYKSFPNRDVADAAYNDNPWKYIGNKKQSPTAGARGVSYLSIPEINKNSIAVDAACSGNPGLLEYRGVFTQDGSEIFHDGPYEEGTNNIGEFLAIVYALALLKKRGSSIPIYSDSATAISWIKKKKCNTKLAKTQNNMTLFYMVERAERWLNSNTWDNEIIKWDTNNWGEIPADFGRK